MGVEKLGGFFFTWEMENKQTNRLSRIGKEGKPIRICCARGMLWLFVNRCEICHLIFPVASRGRHYFPILQMRKLRLSVAHLYTTSMSRDWISSESATSPVLRRTISTGMTSHALFFPDAFQKELSYLINEIGVCEL